MRLGYARVSTEDQNLDLQTDALAKAGCKKIYQEKISSTQASRPALEQLLTHLRPGDTLIVWKLGRLGRSLKDHIGLINKFATKGVNFISVNEKIDTSTPTGQLVFHIFCALAEFEREIIRQRTLTGLQAARASKQVLGRPKGLSKAAQQKAQVAASLYREGALTTADICKQPQISTPTLYRYLKDQNTPLRADVPQTTGAEVIEIL